MTPKDIDQIDKALSRNIEYLDKENYNKLIRLFQTQTQQLQDAIISLADQKNIETAQGIWLDWIGKLVGEKRNGRTDQEYRLALLVKISINAADGTPDNISSIVKKVYTGSEVRIVEYPIASFFITLTSDSQPSGSLWELIDSVKPSGVSATIIYTQDGNVFIPCSFIEEDFNVVFGGVEEPLLLNGEALYVNTLPSGEDASKALLGWLGKTRFSLVSGGVVGNFKLSNSGYLSGVSGNSENTTDKGILSQVITENNI